MWHSPDRNKTQVHIFKEQTLTCWSTGKLKPIPVEARFTLQGADRVIQRRLMQTMKDMIRFSQWIRYLYLSIRLQWGIWFFICVTRDALFAVGLKAGLASPYPIVIWAPRFCHHKSLLSYHAWVLINIINSLLSSRSSHSFCHTFPVYLTVQKTLKAAQLWLLPYRSSRGQRRKTYLTVLKPIGYEKGQFIYFSLCSRLAGTRANVNPDPDPVRLCFTGGTLCQKLVRVWGDSTMLCAPPDHYCLWAICFKISPHENTEMFSCNRECSTIIHINR